MFRVGKRSPTKLLSWLNRGPGASNRWLSQASICVAWFGLLLACLTPPHGTGFTICWIKSATGLPCPGCGLTRSLSCAMRGILTESWHYHPMGLMILALFFVIAVTSLLPRQFRRGVMRHIESHPRFFNTLYLAFVAAFVGFGMIRMLSSLSHLHL